METQFLRLLVDQFWKFQKISSCFDPENPLMDVWNDSERVTHISVHVAYIVWCGILLWLYSARMWLILVLWSIYDSSTASGTSSTASSVSWHWPSFSSSASHVIISNTSQLQADDLKTIDQTCRHIHLPASFFIRYKIVDLYVEYSYLIPFYKKYNEVTLGSILPTSFWIFVNAWSHICAQNLWNQMLSAFNLHFCNGSLLFFKSTLFLFYLFQ